MYALYIGQEHSRELIPQLEKFKIDICVYVLCKKSDGLEMEP
jgi:hypothetical protein